jgi:hypothetical protein
MRFSVNQIKNEYTIFDNFNNRSVGRSSTLEDAEMIARSLNIHTVLNGASDLLTVLKNAIPKKKV